MVTDITMENMQPGGMPEDDDMHIVMFFSPKCSPCKATMPHYEAVSDAFEDRGAKIQFHRINASAPEEQAKFCREVWGIDAYPIFKIFFRGEVIHEKRGGGNEETLKEFIVEGIDEAFKRFDARI